jgi:hypothetical protein
MATTDRIVNKLYAQRVSGGATVNPIISFEGTTTASHIQTTISAGGVGPAGPGVPTGGATGQVLAKIDAVDYNTQWVTPGAGGVTTVTGTAPVVSSGGMAPAISMPAATTSVSGHLTATDWNTFNGKQPFIAAGTTAQYWRGDKSWQTLDKTAVGLGNVDNTSDASKPVSGATQTALDLKADLAGPIFTGDARAVTPATADNDTSIATTAFVKAQGYVTSSGVTSVTGTAPVVSSGGNTPAISMAAATGSVNGYLTSTDWTTFNNKLNASSYTAADVLAKLLTVDGPGSGIDADLVDGRNITVSSTAPVSPAVNDVWIDTT